MRPSRADHSHPPPGRTRDGINGSPLNGCKHSKNKEGEIKTIPIRERGKTAPKKARNRRRVWDFVTWNLKTMTGMHLQILWRSGDNGDNDGNDDSEEQWWQWWPWSQWWQRWQWSMVTVGDGGDRGCRGDRGDSVGVTVLTVWTVGAVVRVAVVTGHVRRTVYGGWSKEFAGSGYQGRLLTRSMC
jgi:hypothetical protein